MKGEMAHPDPKAKSQNIWTGFSEDGLVCPEVKQHTRGKLQMLGYYLEIVAKAMSGLFDKLYYIDLYAGSGRGRMKTTGEIIEGSPMIACRTLPHFAKLILCEADPTFAAALRVRIGREFPHLSAKVIRKSCDDAIADIKAELPASYRGLLATCFVDPFNLGIRLRTIRQLALLKIDFVTLIADRMAGLRNVSQLVAPVNDTIEYLLDDPHWRERWGAAERDGARFDAFITREFITAMSEMGFKSTVPDRVNVINMSVGLYRLVLFSKSDRALEFWSSASKHAPDQRKLF